MTDEVAFQRTGSTNALGVLDDELQKIRIGSETLARLRLLAVQEGLSLSEFVRLHLECKAWGADVVASVAASRIRRVGGNGGQP